jgi:hypothetical protein
MGLAKNFEKILDNFIIEHTNLVDTHQREYICILLLFS